MNSIKPKNKKYEISTTNQKLQQKRQMGHWKLSSKVEKPREIRETERALHLGRLVFLLAAVGSVDPAPAAIEDAIVLGFFRFLSLSMLRKWRRKER